MGELGAVSFIYEGYSVPNGIKMTERGALIVRVESNEHLTKVRTFFIDLLASLEASRDTYGFRRDKSAVNRGASDA